MKPEQIDATVADIHAQNVAAGWWPANKDERNVGEILMLCVSELAEAMEGHRKNLPDDKLPHRPMFEVELADTVIRTFDLVGAKCPDGFGDLVEDLRDPIDPPPENAGKALLEIVKLFCEADDHFDRDHPYGAQGALAHAYVLIEELATARGFDLWGAIEEKRAFNRVRPDHKLEARMAPGGKAY